MIDAPEPTRRLCPATRPPRRRPVVEREAPEPGRDLRPRAVPEPERDPKAPTGR